MLYQIRKTPDFDDWIEKLKDDLAVSAIAKRLTRMQLGNLGDIKPIGGGVSELRIHYGPGYRIYLQRRGHEIVLLLCRGDKSSQKRDIDRARQLAKSWSDQDG